MFPYILTDFIKTQALNLGFNACGITQPSYPKADIIFFKNWLKNNYNGQMYYLSNNLEKRIDLKKLYPDVKSAVIVLISYNTKKEQIDKTAPKISKYAWGIDYHKIVKKKLKNLLTITKNHFKTLNIDGRIYVDSAPVMERSLAVQAGLGWIGKNSCLINPALGSFTFIGVLLLNVYLNYDKPFNIEKCGKCEKCINSCPTKAIIKPKLIDSRKCISYLTIEYKFNIPDELKKYFCNYVFGCDICQNVCPWNKKPLEHNIPDFKPNQEFLEMTKKNWLSLTMENYKELFSKTPINRIKFEGLTKNIKSIFY